MKKFNCKICSRTTTFTKVLTRSKIKKKLFKCKSCDFEFFYFNPTKNLEANKLDISRLEGAGLKVPTIYENFKRTIYQSNVYVKNYLNKKDKNKKILEIGCSHGSFLYLAKKFGCKVYGLEINNYLRNHLNKKMKIKCFKTLNEIKKIKLKFSKIFLFYSFEYFFDIKNELNLIKNLLEPKGQIILITPNKNDVLKSLSLNKGYKNFFYDINSINYFSTQSLRALMRKMNFSNYKISLNQGYGIANLFNWTINQKPKKTGLVGEDDFLLQTINNFKINKKSKKQNSTINKIKKILSHTEKKYKRLLEKEGYGNQIILRIIK